MLTSYRQKYNPKKPKPKVKLFASVVQTFFQKIFSSPQLFLKSLFAAY